MAANTIYKGNTIDNFGRYMPCPHIDKIELWDVLEEERAEVAEEIGIILGPSDDLSRIKIYFSLLIHEQEGFDIESYMQDLYRDLYISTILTTNVEYRDRLMQDRRNLQSVVMDMFTTGETLSIQEVADALETDAPYTNFGNLNNQFRVNDLSEFDLDFTFTTQYDQDDNAIMKTSSIVLEMYTPRINQKSDMAIFVGISAAPPKELITYPPIFMAMSYGDLATENIKKDGIIANRNQVGFFSVDPATGAEGEFYTGLPMLGTDGQYYKTDNFNVDEVKAALDDLQIRYAPQASRNADLNTIMANVDFIYEKYGGTPKYLAELHAYRKSILDQDINTDVGQYNDSYRIAVNNAMTALAEDNDLVVKRITYSSKLRDWRASQFAPVTTATYDMALFEDHEYLYNVILQTSIAKYVEARNDEDPSSINPLFTPEAPYTSEEMRVAYYDAIHDKLKRFYSTYTDRTFRDIAGFGTGGTNEGLMMIGEAELAGYADEKIGMDNVTNFVAVNTNMMIDKAVTHFTLAYAAMGEWLDETRIYLGGYGDGSGGVMAGGKDDPPGFDKSDIYKELKATYGDDWREHYGALGVDVGEEEMCYNHKAFESALAFLGEKGNPVNPCTLEFGYDTTLGPPDSAGNYSCREKLGMTLGYDDSTGEIVPNVFFTNPVDSHTGAGGLKAYRCFEQLRPFINVAGCWEEEFYEDLNTSDPDSGDEGADRFGFYKYYVSFRSGYGNSDYDHYYFKSENWFGDRIRDLISTDPWLLAASSGGGYTGEWGSSIQNDIQTTFNLILSTMLGVPSIDGVEQAPVGGQSYFLNMLGDHNLWTEVNAEWNLYDGSRILNSNLDAFAVNFADAIEDTIWAILDHIANDELARTYRLRWCPLLGKDDIGTHGITEMDFGSSPQNYDLNYGKTNPYGGYWKYLTEPRYKRTAANQPWQEGSDGYTSELSPYFYTGGFTASNDGVFVIDASTNLTTVGTFEYQLPSWSLTTTNRWLTDPQYALQPSNYNIGDRFAEVVGSKISPGRAVYNFAAEAVTTIKQIWQFVWRQDVLDLCHDVIPMIAEYHGLTMSAGLQNKMAYVDIIVQKYGWFFFDMEKYIMKQSNLSQYMNPKAIESFFTYGRSMVNMTTKIDEVYFHRFDGQGDSFGGGDSNTASRSDGTHVEMTLDKHSGYIGQPDADISLRYKGWANAYNSTAGASTNVNTGLPYPYAPIADVASWRDISSKGTEGGIGDMDSTTSSYLFRTEYEPPASYNNWSYLVQRNYDFAGTTYVPNDYRLACFAFSYYVDDDVALRAPDDAYYITVKVRDSSEQIVIAIHSYMQATLEAFEEYADLAAENCSYNQFDSRFNQFFIDKMSQEYGERMHEAPWQRAASAIPFVEDIFYARYGGELSVILEAANVISDSVNPYSGTLDQILHYVDYFRNFVEQLDIIKANIYEDHYELTDAGYIQLNTSKYKTYVLGNIETDYSPTRDFVFIHSPIIDYAAMRTEEFPNLPRQNDIGQDAVDRGVDNW